MKLHIAWLAIMLFALRGNAREDANTDTTMSLEECIQYGYQHSPLLLQSELNERITEHAVKSRLADWYPQLNLDFSFQHNFQLQVANINGQIIPMGQKNTSLGQLSLTQNIFNSDAILASSTARDIKLQASQNTELNRINLSVNIGKAFYDVLLTKEQLKILDENIVRLDRSLQDAYNQYEGGIVDKVDYKRATIALNNTVAQRKSAESVLKAKYSYLKMQMGFADSVALQLSYDSAKLEDLAMIDTAGVYNVQNRVEYQLLQTQQNLQSANYNYYKWQILPTVQAFGNYNLNFLSQEFSALYANSYPNSFAGLRISLPIFNGLRRVQSMKQARLELKSVDYDMEQLKNSVNSEVSQALASYKSYMNDYYSLKENVAIAQEVYNTIDLQYKAGIKTYLEVITAQTDLRTSELNYSNALYQLLAGKLELQRVLGQIQAN